MQMNVSLPAKMYDLVQNKVRSGRYSNASEVVRDALRRLDEEQAQDRQWQRLAALLAAGERSGRSKLSASEVIDDELRKRAK